MSTTAVTDGGPAFPVTNDPILPSSLGMSLRAYLVAHAPPDPWPWFRPQLEAPTSPPPPDDESWNFTESDRRSASSWFADPCYDLSASPGCSEELIRFETEWEAYWEVKGAFNEELKSQRDLQWPAFWADRMLEQLQKEAA